MHRPLNRKLISTINLWFSSPHRHEISQTSNKSLKFFPLQPLYQYRIQWCYLWRFIQSKDRGEASGRPGNYRLYDLSSRWYFHSYRIFTRLDKERLIPKTLIRSLGINQLALLWFWCIASGRSLLLRWFPGVELLDDLRVDTIELLLGENAE